MTRALTKVTNHTKANATRVFTWTDRYRFGFGKTPRERLISDLALVLHRHEVGQAQEADQLDLAKALVVALDRKLHAAWMRKATRELSGRK